MNRLGTPPLRGGPQPKGWSGDAYGGLTFPLPGADADYPSITNTVSSDPVGGARVIVVPYQQAGETPRAETAVLVHEFIHDILFPDINGFYNDFGVLTNAVEEPPSRYRDRRLPSTRRIYHESQTVGYDWYQVASSAYEYIALKYGMNRMFAAAALLTTNDNTPFGNVLAPSKNGNLVFYSASSIQSGWRAWLAGL